MCSSYAVENALVKRQDCPWGLSRKAQSKINFCNQTGMLQMNLKAEGDSLSGLLVQCNVIKQLRYIFLWLGCLSLVLQCSMCFISFIEIHLMIGNKAGHSGINCIICNFTCIETRLKCCFHETVLFL